MNTHHVPTLFRRSPLPPYRLMPLLTPGCEWASVTPAEGMTATRWYEGATVAWTPVVDGELSVHGIIGLLAEPDDITGRWMLRTKVPAESPIPDVAHVVHLDPERGLRTQWTPLDESGADAVAGATVFDRGPFALGTFALLLDALREAVGTDPGPFEFGTYTLSYDRELSTFRVRLHYEADVLDGVPTRFNDLMVWLVNNPQVDGVVWKHNVAGLAKVKRRDALAFLPSEVAAPTQPG